MKIIIDGKLNSFDEQKLAPYVWKIYNKKKIDTSYYIYYKFIIIMLTFTRPNREGPLLIRI